MVKHVSNSGAIVKPTITTYMHIVSTEVLVTIMMLLPKPAEDQDAVDAVTGQRDTITRTAADTEVHLPFARDPDQASTAAPPDDEQDLFGREEALRMDEEIMNFQWFDQRHVGQHQRLAGHDVRSTAHNVLVCLATSSTCHPTCNHSQQPFLIGIRASLESARAQRLAPPGATCCQCV